MTKFFKNIKVPDKIKIVDPVIISKAQHEYFLRALRYATKYGFKITLFDDQGKVTGFQG